MLRSRGGIKLAAIASGAAGNPSSSINNDDTASSSSSSPTTPARSIATTQWSAAVSAYYAALLSGSDLSVEPHAAGAVKGVVSTMSRMPSSPAVRVLSSMGSLSEESPAKYGPQLIEAATAAATASSSNNNSNSALTTITTDHLDAATRRKRRRQQRSGFSDDEEDRYTHSPERRKYVAAKYALQQHRLSLFDDDVGVVGNDAGSLSTASEEEGGSNSSLSSSSSSRRQQSSGSRVAANAVANCMAAGRWEDAIRIVATLPELLRDEHAPTLHSTGTSRSQAQKQSQQPHRMLHAEAYFEAIHSAIQHNQSTAVSTLVQILKQQQQQQSTKQHDFTAKNHRHHLHHYSQPPFVLSGLKADDLRRMLWDIRESRNGWRIASLFFSSSITLPLDASSTSSSSRYPSSAKNKMLRTSDKELEKEHTDRGMAKSVLLDSSVVKASLAVLATHNRSREIEKLIKWRTDQPVLNKHAPQLQSNSATISSCVRVLRESPWHVALECASRLYATAEIPAKISVYAAVDIANLVSSLGNTAHWQHAAAAFQVLHDASRARSASSSSSSSGSSQSGKQKSKMVVTTLEAQASSRLTVKLAEDGHYDLASRSLRYVRASEDSMALAAALNGMVLATTTVQQADAWITTMVEDQVAPSLEVQEHLVRLHCSDGNWEQALCCVRDFLSSSSSSDEEVGKVAAAVAAVGGNNNNSNNDETEKILEQFSSITADHHHHHRQQQQQQQQQQRRSTTVSTRTHLQLQRALRKHGAPWDVAIRSFVELEASDRSNRSDREQQQQQQQQQQRAQTDSGTLLPTGRSGISNRSGRSGTTATAATTTTDAQVRQVAEAFRNVVATCMEQGQPQAGQDLLSLMIRRGVGRR